jgi:arsenate reductase
MAAAALDEAGVDYEVRRYLDEPPSRAELVEVLDRLGLEPWDITRMGEARAAELGLADLPHERDAWLDVLADNPVLIQRPIVVTDDGSAWIARDEETLGDVVERGRSSSRR